MSKRCPEWMQPGSVFHEKALQAKRRKEEATVILVVCRDDPECIPDDVYLLSALQRGGLTPQLVNWDDMEAPWHRDDGCRPRVVLLRSLFEYAEPGKSEEFRSFLQRLIQLRWEPRADLAAILWSYHKRYLLDLMLAGIETVPTVLVRQGSSVDEVERAMRVKGWEPAVFKPCLGSQGDGVEQISLTAGSAIWGAKGLVKRELASRDMLLQPFLPLVATQGEVCLVYVRGSFCQMVHKDPKLWKSHGSRAYVEANSPGAANHEVSIEEAPESQSGRSEAIPPLITATPERWRACQRCFERQEVCQKEPDIEQRSLADRTIQHLASTAAGLLGETQNDKSMPLLARIDLLPTRCSIKDTGSQTRRDKEAGNGPVRWVISEIETFGPEMFLRLQPGIADQICAALEACR